MNVELPLMHQSVELLLKAFACRYDPHFDPMRFSHGTTRLLSAYSDRIAMFRSLIDDSESMTLVRGLEDAWTPVRYGESYIEYEGSDWNLIEISSYGLPISSTLKRASGCWRTTTYDSTTRGGDAT